MRFWFFRQQIVQQLSKHCFEKQQPSAFEIHTPFYVIVLQRYVCRSTSSHVHEISKQVLLLEVFILVCPTQLGKKTKQQTFDCSFHESCDLSKSSHISKKITESTILCIWIHKRRHMHSKRSMCPCKCDFYL